ncbi:hypothetical protein [Hoeflea sp.]|uniref:hypothetical protein n=1 Tax=Hoeflea sp. TaxID=1940281 RepID=UPI003B027FD4
MAGTGNNLAKSSDHSSEQTAQSLTTLLLKLQLELAEVAQLIEAAEAVLCKVHGDGKHVNPEDIPVIQGMDLAIQKTRGLRAGFKSYSNVTIPCETPRHEPDACYERPRG